MVCSLYSQWINGIKRSLCGFYSKIFIVFQLQLFSAIQYGKYKDAGKTFFNGFSIFVYFYTVPTKQHQMLNFLLEINGFVGTK